MKTLEDLYEEMLASDALKEEAAAAAAGSGGLAEFAAAHGVEASDADFAALLSGLDSQAPARELSLEELDNVAGGGCNGTTQSETLMSILSLGTGCATYALDSALSGHTGQRTADEGRLCTK